MRRLLLLLALLGTVYGTWQYPTVLETWLNQILLRMLPSPVNFSTSVSICYQLDEEGWLSFDLGPGVSKVKVITNANIATTSKTTEELSGRYAVEYQLENKTTGEIYKTGTYYFTTRLTLYKGGSGKLYAPAFYKDADSVPMDGRIMRIDLSWLPDQHSSLTLGFRLVKLVDPVENVVLRLYSANRTSERKLSFLWERLKRGQKEKLAKGNVYSYDFLTETEKKNLLRFQWGPTAPTGISGRDYSMRRMHVIRDEEIKPSVEFLAGSDDIFVDRELNLMIPLPEDGARLAISFNDPDDISAGEDVLLHWYGGSIRERQSWRLPWAQKEKGITHFFKGGLLELKSGSYLAVSVQDAASGNLFLWDNLKSRMFVATQDQAVSFAINHLPGKAASFRFTFRRLLPQKNDKNAKIAYTIYNKKGSVLRSGSFFIAADPSSYDLIKELWPDTMVTDPHKLYFVLPEQAVSITFHSSQPFLIAGSNRPPEQIAITMVPDDYLTKVKDEHRQWTWFPVLPIPPSQNEAFSSEFITLQPRPPQDNDEILAGRYLWESFRPVKDWAGHYLLSHMESLPITRREAIASTYKSLVINTTVSVDLGTEFGHPQVRPNLIFLREKNTPLIIALKQDEKNIENISLWGQHGILRLSSLRTGKSRINFASAEPVDIFLSHTQSSGDHLLRFANKLEDLPLVFDYEKKSMEEELLSMIFYPGAGDDWPLTIRAELSGPSPRMGAFSQLTVFRKKYIIREPSTYPVVVLHSNVDNVADGRKLFFRLGPDLAPGKYRLSLWEEKGRGGYLILYRIKAGRHEKRKISKGEH